MENDMQEYDTQGATVAAVDIGELNTAMVSQEINQFFDSRKGEIQVPPAAPANTEAIVAAIKTEFDKIKDNQTSGEYARILAGALDFVQFVADNTGDKLNFDFRDFDVIEKFLATAHNEYESQEITPAELPDVVNLFSNYIKAVILSTVESPSQSAIQSIAPVVDKIIQTGDLSLVNLLKKF